MSRDLSDYRRRQNLEYGSKPRAGGVIDTSRAILFLILGLAAIAGFIYNSHYNNPMNILKLSVSKTIDKPFKASIEGKTVLQDSVIATYRSREGYVPGQVKPSPAGTSAPLTAWEALNMVRNALHAYEMDREDMYGRPTRHFYGDTACEKTEPGRPTGFYFEYWTDMRDLKAVRLILTGVCRGAAVDAQGDSISAETSINIGFY
jgi:hypothetical protein